MRSLRRRVWPYIIWLFILILIPSLFIFLATISTFHIFNAYTFHFTLDSLKFLQNSIFINAFLNSLKFAGITTLLYVALLIVPIWSNMIVRIIAWENIFKPVSILNLFNLSFDVIGSDGAIILAMISMYLPFMIFPIYSVLDKLDHGYIEASRDLGADAFQTFYKVTLPLSLGGIVSGIIMTLLPAMTAFALPERIGGGRVVLLGNLIEKEIFRGSFSNAATVSFVVMIVMRGLFALIVHFDKEGETLL